MVKEQILNQGLIIPVRSVSNNDYRIFQITPEFLDNDFYVQAELVKQDVYDEVEALQRAQLLMQNRLLSREDIMERVMLEPDVQTQITKMDMEDVEAAVPELKLKRLIKAYREDKQMPEEAEMLEKELAMLELQKYQSLAGAQGGQTLPGGPPQSGEGV